MFLHLSLLEYIFIELYICWTTSPWAIYVVVASIVGLYFDLTKWVTMLLNEARHIKVHETGAQQPIILSCFCVVMRPGAKGSYNNYVMIFSLDNQVVFFKLSILNLLNQGAWDASGKGGDQKTNSAKALFTRPFCSKQKENREEGQHCSTKATPRPPH